MAKRRRRKRSLGFSNPFQDIDSGILRGVWSILLLLIGLFLLFAAIGFAGVVGKAVFKGLYGIFGWGYVLLPLLSILVAISLVRPLEYEFGALKIFATVLFFLSGLGIIEIMFDHGGMVGSLVTSPLIGLFEIYVTIFILWGIELITLIVLLDIDFTTASFPLLTRLFSRKHADDGTYTISGSDLEEDVGDEEEYEKDEEEDEEDISEESKSYKKETETAPAKESGLAFTPIRGGTFSPPPLSLLEKDRGKPGVGDIKANANIIKRTLQNFRITVEIDEISIGPSVTRYALKPAEGVRLSKILGLQNNLELALAAHPVRIEAPIPGKSLVGIEVPNTSKTTVGLATLLANDAFQNSNKPLLVALGKDIAGHTHFANLAKMPHLLIAGATGAGKSVTIHALLTSLLFRNSPEILRFIMIDPKRVELTLYKNIPHLLTPVVTDAKKTILALKWATKEMERRYDILESEQVRDIASYHSNVLAPALKKKKAKDEEMPAAMPYIVIVIDELADIMQAYPRELESAIVRLAQMSRAVGIHLILSTQRPSVNIITGLIKANIPTRIALQVSSQIDSRTILDTGGAEKLLGAGDMLYLSGEMSKPIRIQSAFISELELKKVTQYLIKHNEDEVPNEIVLSNDSVSDKNSIFNATLDDDPDEDELYGEARETVERAGKASTSYLQRKLRIGYARAARLMDILEERGIIGPADGSKPREVFTDVNDEDTGDNNDSYGKDNR